MSTPPNDHPFEAIIWVSAKTSLLTSEGVKRIGNEVVEALSLIDDAASYEPGPEDPVTRLRRLLEQNTILLVIDNLETVQGDEIKRLAEDVPGDSKILLTSRVPLGGDLSITVSEFDEKESMTYLRRLISAYDVSALQLAPRDVLRSYLSRLHHKPLLIKWFVLGVNSGAEPLALLANPSEVLRFCLENVIGRLSNEAKIALVAFATISKPLSSQLTEHVTELSPVQTEVALNELKRFGLIDIAEANASEQRYRIRSFARSYAMRVLAPKQELTNSIRSSHNSVDSRFQSARGMAAQNPYSMKNFVIRSASEMLAVNKLRHAVSTAMREDFSLANKMIEELRISNPGYFEVYCAQGFIYHLNGDINGACASYESALELAPDQAQLHFFYGCMLMKGIDAELADQHFEACLMLDPDCMVAARESSRNCMQRFEFERALQLLEHAATLPFRSDKDRRVYADIRIQVYVRAIGYAFQTQNTIGIGALIQNLAHFVYALDLGLFDARMVEHLISVMPYLARALEENVGSTAYAEDLQTWVQTRLISRSGWQRDTTGNLNRVAGPAVGALKSAGLQPNYGFLRADDGRDTFVHETDAGPELWAKMREGRRVRYEVKTHTDGRSRASNLLPC